MISLYFFNQPSILIGKPTKSQLQIVMFGKVIGCYNLLLRIGERGLISQAQESMKKVVYNKFLFSNFSTNIKVIYILDKYFSYLTNQAKV